MNDEELIKEAIRLDYSQLVMNNVYLHKENKRLNNVINELEKELDRGYLDLFEHELVPGRELEILKELVPYKILSPTPQEIIIEIERLNDTILSLENERDILRSKLSDIKADIHYLLENGESVYIRNKYIRGDKE